MTTESVKQFPCDTCGKMIWGGWFKPGGFGKPNPVQCGACCDPPREEKPAPQTRPDWNNWFMRLAHVTAQRGSCLRKRVGALIVRDRDKRIISGGYNGAPRGMPDCLEVGCEMREIAGKESCVRTIHAESNALDLAGPLNEPHTLYVTVIPCRDCALRIIQNGWIKKVVYSEYYESRSSKDTADLFAAHDADTIAAMTKKWGPPENIGWIATPRVELVMWTTEPQEPLPKAIPDDEFKALQGLAWRIFVAQHTQDGIDQKLDRLARELCHALGVTTEPDEA